MIIDQGWVVVGASVTGAAHLTEGGDCQDAHAWRTTSRGDLIIVVCDGAGSSSHGGEAARFVAPRLCEAPTLDEWLGRSGDEEEWRKFAEVLFRQVRGELEAFASSAVPAASLQDFACTVQLAAVTHSAVFVAHIGDGRAAVRFEGSDEWVALYVPDRGEEANETVFLSTPLPFDADYWRRGAACWSRGVDAIAVMTDGCEMTAFECYVPDEDRGWHDPNRPFPGFFDPIAGKLKSLAVTGIGREGLDAKWHAFIHGGLPRLAAESDDRTMVFGVRSS